MAQQPLDISGWDILLSELDRECVPESVRVDPPGNTGRSCGPPDHLPGVSGRDRLPCSAAEHRGGGYRAPSEPALEDGCCLLVQADRPGLPTLPFSNPDRLTLEVYIIGDEREGLCAPESGPPECNHECSVPVPVSELFDDREDLTLLEMSSLVRSAKVRCDPVRVLRDPASDRGAGLGPRPAQHPAIRPVCEFDTVPLPEVEGPSIPGFYRAVGKLHVPDCHTRELYPVRGVWELRLCFRQNFLKNLCDSRQNFLKNLCDSCLLPGESAGYLGSGRT